MIKTRCFIIHYNRPTMLKQQLDALSKHPDLDIWIIDNNSDERYDDIIMDIAGPYKLFASSENEGHRVVWSRDISRELCPNDPYIVTDCDTIPPPNVDYVSILCSGLDKYPHVNKVGLELNISRIPDKYPLRDKVVHHEKKFLYRKDILRERNFVYAPVDTTFAMYRAGYHHYSEWGTDKPGWSGECRSLRTKQAVYEADHLGWHITDPDEETKFYWASIENTITGHWKQAV